MGDHVFLKVKSNRISLKLGSYSKLAAIFCGPFEILERLGPVAYMLALPASMTVHNVFHVSLLKKYIPYANHVSDSGGERRLFTSASGTHSRLENITSL